MKIEREVYPQSTLEAFADEHGLVMQITERGMDQWQRTHGLPRYVAHFKSAEVKDGAMLSATYGEGNTEEAAMDDYARLISCERLVINAWQPARREIRVPRLTT